MDSIPQNSDPRVHNQPPATSEEAISPGPWREAGGNCGEMVGVLDATGRPVFMLGRRSALRPANIKAVLAVPELVGACRETLRKINFRLWQKGAEPSPAEMTAWRSQVEAALAKAGQSGAAPHSVPADAEFLAAASKFFLSVNQYLRQLSDAGKPLPVFDGIADLHDALGRYGQATE